MRLYRKTHRKCTQVQEILKSDTAALAALTVDEFQAQTTFWSTRSAVATRALSDARMQHTEREGVVTHLQEQLTNFDARLLEIDKSLTELDAKKENLHNQTAGINAQLEELRKLIEPTEMDLETAAAQELDLQKQETEGQAALARVERTYNQVQLDLGRKQEMLANLRQKIEDDFGLVAFDYAI